ncbi:alpha/beta hydrolase family protein [Sinomicrobium sp. M5D2P17]
MMMHLGYILVYFISVYFPLSETTRENSYEREEAGIGQMTLEFRDNSRDRPVVTEIWYPTTDSLKTSDIMFSPFVRKYTVRNGRLPEGKYPLIMISHGTGGSRLSLEWMAQHLVQKGFMVAAVDHWGNTYDNKIDIEFVKPWERPLDMSFALTELLKNPSFGNIIDSDRIGALGFSFGGYTVLALAGGVLDYDILLDYYTTETGREELDRITEIPDMAGLVFDPSLKQMTKSLPNLKDTRFKAFFAISPGTAQGFVSRKQFEEVTGAVFLVGCAADKVTPPERYAGHYHKLIEGSQYYEFPGKTGHYVMLAEAREDIKEELPGVFRDDAPVNRGEVHRNTGDLATAFFSRELR